MHLTSIFEKRKMFLFENKNFDAFIVFHVFLRPIQMKLKNLYHIFIFDFCFYRVSTSEINMFPTE